jgi:hypothetical protein
MRRIWVVDRGLATSKRLMAAMQTPPATSHDECALICKRAHPNSAPSATTMRALSQTRMAARPIKRHAIALNVNVATLT